mmetsp:Transcript_66576/g.216664  ORF Transcript_66576/g.216664 Transcript_66576/m.216664 type:complete len:291 (+) Transcript_66576:134-1006(+)
MQSPQVHEECDPTAFKDSATLVVVPAGEETLVGSEYAHLAVAVAHAPTPMATGSARRNLWGMYSSTVLRKGSSGCLRQSQRGASPTRGAQECAKLTRGESGGLSGGAGTPSTSLEAGTEQVVVGSSSEMQMNLPVEDAEAETEEAVPVEEPPEIARARERAARARENAAKAVERARAQHETQCVAEAAAKVRRRLPAKQKSPAAFPPPPGFEANADVASAASPCSSGKRSPSSSGKRKLEETEETVSPTPPCIKTARTEFGSEQKKQQTKEVSPASSPPQRKGRPARRRL